MRVNNNTNIETLREMMGPDFLTAHAEIMLELLQLNQTRDTDDVSNAEWDTLTTISFRINRINEINAWREEAVKAATTRQQVEAIDREVLRLHERLEVSL
jgi:hypothetical protein